MRWKGGGHLSVSFQATFHLLSSPFSDSLSSRVRHAKTVLSSSEKSKRSHTLRHSFGQLMTGCSEERKADWWSKEGGKQWWQRKRQTNSNVKGGRWGSKRKEMKGKNSKQSQCFWSIYQFSPILKGNYFFNKLLPQTIKHISDILTGLDRVWRFLRCGHQTTTGKVKLLILISYYSRKLQQLWVADWKGRWRNQYSSITVCKVVMSTNYCSGHIKIFYMECIFMALNLKTSCVITNILTPCLFFLSWIGAHIPESVLMSRYWWGAGQQALRYPDVKGRQLWLPKVLL